MGFFSPFLSPIQFRKPETIAARRQTAVSMALVLLLITLKCLLLENMGETNELDVLPLARQFVNPNWIPADWYLNQPSHYRLLFEAIAGQSIEVWGFLATSIAGRFFCYCLVAAGLVLMQRRLGLSLPLMLPAVAWILYWNNGRGLIAREWIVGALEAKAIAYGLVLLGLAALLHCRYRWTAFCLGLATSFHVLVGGWTSLVVLVWGLWRRSKIGLNRFQWLQIGLIYLASSAAAISPILRQLASPTPNSEVSPSLLYVFVRLGHHLNPLTWTPLWIPGFILYGVLLTASMVFLERRHRAVDAAQTGSATEQTQQFLAQKTLFELTLLALVPFLLGVAIARFDAQGRLLQFYWFRLGDVMLPLSTVLLASCAIQQWAAPKVLSRLKLGCIAGIAVLISLQFFTFQEQLAELRSFPIVDPDLQAICTWIKRRTPKETIVITPPVELTRFTWLSERGTIAKFKFLPQNKASLVEWYRRLRDLGGGTFPISADYRNRPNRGEISQALTTGYNRLSTRQVRDLMQKYGATYFLTQSTRQLNLPIARRTETLTLYRRSGTDARSPVESP